MYCLKVLGPHKADHWADGSRLFRLIKHAGRGQLGEAQAGDSLRHPRTPASETHNGPASCQDFTSRTSQLAAQGWRGLNPSGHSCPSFRPTRLAWSEAAHTRVAGLNPGRRYRPDPRSSIASSQERPLQILLLRSGCLQSCPSMRGTMPSFASLRHTTSLGNPATLRAGWYKGPGLRYPVYPRPIVASARASSCVSQAGALLRKVSRAVRIKALRSWWSAGQAVTKRGWLLCRYAVGRAVSMFPGGLLEGGYDHLSSPTHSSGPQGRVKSLLTNLCLDALNLGGFTRLFSTSPRVGGPLCQHRGLRLSLGISPR